jgi:hypothetical protein
MLIYLKEKGCKVNNSKFHKILQQTPNSLYNVYFPNSFITGRSGVITSKELMGAEIFDWLRAHTDIGIARLIL